MHPMAAFAVSYFVSDSFRTPTEDSVHGDVNMAANTGDLQKVSSVALKMKTLGNIKLYSTLE